MEPGDPLGQSPHFIDGKTGPERRRDLPRVTQKVGGRAEAGPLSETMSQPLPTLFWIMPGCPLPTAPSVIQQILTEHLQFAR